MTSIINYDLSSEPVHRRVSELFDQDWALLLDVSQNNGLRVTGESSGPLAVCSCREFDAGQAKQDALADGQGYWAWFKRESREVVIGANR